MKRIALLSVAVVLLLAWNAKAFSDPHEPHPQPSPVLGTTLPSDFPVIINPYLGVPVLGFGASGSRGRPFEERPFDQVPVIFLHGNNDTPFATACNPFGYIHNLAQFFLNNGYAPSQLWGLGYQGDQCDLISSPTNKSGIAHSTAAAVPLLRQFVHAVMQSTGARQVDIVAHSLGVTVAREWMFQDNAYNIVRSLVAIEGPNHGIIDCSPDPGNFFQLAGNGGFIPTSAICDEYGKEDTQLLTTLNAAGESPGPTRYLVLRNIFRASPESGDFVYLSAQDGPFFPAVPAEDSTGAPHDFSDSALLAGAPHTDFVGQGQFDTILGTSHLGILNSPDVWSAAFQFLNH
jgi:pimeloyl-ACP methyl ester carboxylesterase